MVFNFKIHARHFRDSTDFVDNCPLNLAFKEFYNKDISVGLSTATIDNTIYNIICINNNTTYNGFNYNILYDILNKNKFVNKNIKGTLNKFKDLIRRKKKVGTIDIILLKKL